MVGQRFGSLVVIKRVQSENKRDKWLCKCDCGNEKEVLGYSLRSGNTKSCGCYQRKKAAEHCSNMSTHGLFGSRIYRIWSGIKNRCQNNKSKDYNKYGARGISLCSEWQNFEIFYEWATKNGYQNNLTIDRIDNNKGYSPDNCRWVTIKTQSRNRRTNTYIEFNGMKKCLSEWDEYIGAKSSGVVRQRLIRGWSVEKAITTPVKTIREA